MDIQNSLFSDIAPVQKLTRSEIAKKAHADRLELAKECFNHQDGKFKDAFKDYFDGFLRANKGRTFSFPDVTEPYSRRKDMPQPKMDFRCTGAVAIKYQKLGLIRQVSTTKDKKSKRIIPIYLIV
jgi:hypothetical protein